ncbi:MAG: endonuclease III domain-containing protein, partial [Candidatus Latescibacteria bacterium]|nr:endonuclease III domain-containing protein [Candidatus Latescibacterota bacterium]
MNRKKRRELLCDLYTVLEETFGPMRWWPAETPFEVCIGAILTQNAPWSGVVEAIKNLKNAHVFDSFSLAASDERTIAEAIRPSIYYNQKAK